MDEVIRKAGLAGSEKLCIDKEYCKGILGSVNAVTEKSWCRIIIEEKELIILGCGRRIRDCGEAHVSE